MTAPRKAKPKMVVAVLDWCVEEDEPSRWFIGRCLGLDSPDHVEKLPHGLVKESELAE